MLYETVGEYIFFIKANVSLKYLNKTSQNDIYVYKKKYIISCYKNNVSKSIVKGNFALYFILQRHNILVSVE